MNHWNRETWKELLDYLLLKRIRTSRPIPLCVFSVSIFSLVLSIYHFQSAASYFPDQVSAGHLVFNKVVFCCSISICCEAPSIPAILFSIKLFLLFNLNLL